MFTCRDCGSIFDEPESIEYCYEDYCGVSGILSGRHYGNYDGCPFCGSDDIRSVPEEDDEDYYTDEIAIAQ